MAAYTALAYIQVTTLEFQGRIGFDTGDGWDVRFHEQGRDDLHNTPDQDGHGGQQGQLNGLALQPGVVFLTGSPSGTDPRQGRCLGQFILHLASGADGNDDVVKHHKKSYQVKGTPYGAHPVHGQDFVDGFQEVSVDQGPVRVEFLPHQGLCKSGDIHRQGIEDDPQRADPEVEIRHGRGMQPGLEHTGDQPVDHTEGQKAVPGQGPHVHVGDDPVTEVGDGIDIFQGQHGAFKGGHPVSGNGDYHELEHRARTNLIPGTP